MKHHTPHWHRGLHALHFGFLGGLVAVTFLGTLFITVFSPVWVQQADAAVSRFASGSFWDTTIPGYTDLNPDSNALVANIVSQVGSHGATITKDISSTYYEVDSAVTTVAVVPYDCGSGVNGGLASQWAAVPVPFYAVPGGGAKPQMIIYQPSSGTIWEFGGMRNVAGQWQACTGGQIASASSGVFASPYGITSSGLAALGGQISAQELTAGTINHVVGLTLPSTNGISWPASQYVGNTSGTPAMGQRLRLDPSINIDALGLSGPARAIAQAAQTYGLVVWNNGGFVGFTAESPNSSTNRGLPDPYGSSISNSTLNGFPWDKLQVLPANYGQSGGVPTITKFTASSSAIKADSRVTLTWKANNVTRCAIGGIADNLGASGSVQSGVLLSDSTFVLRCGGPLGTTTSQLNISVSPININEEPRELPPGSIIDQPFAGYANIFSDLMNGADTNGVYKVVYYTKKTYISENATPPFALNTLRLNNGRYTVDAKIYYRDGHDEERTVSVAVDNTPEVLSAVTQSQPVKTGAKIPLLWSLVGGLSAITVMSLGTWWGWHRAHLF